MGGNLRLSFIWDAQILSGPVSGTGRTGLQRVMIACRQVAIWKNSEEVF